jgi:hypothetical protein
VKLLTDALAAGRALVTPRRLVALFVFGGLGGAMCDQIHVQAGVLSYPTPWLAGQAWWVGPNFGLATLLIALGTLPFAAPLAARAPAAPRGREIAVAAALFVAAYLASGLLAGSPRALALGYALTFAARLWPRPERGPLALYAVGLAIGGTSYEAALAGTGAFAYAAPELAGVPLWLPGLYLHGAFLAALVLRKLAGSASPTPGAGAAAPRA